MLVDINCNLGHYPFRRLRNNDAAGLIATMDRYGISKAVISSLHCLFYRDVQVGNQELIESTRGHASRLVPVATVNPKYVDWHGDLDIAVEKWHVPAIALAPAYHGYRLDDEFGQAVLAAIAKRDIPVMLAQRFEDRRQRHAWDQAEDLAAQDVMEAAVAFPSLRFALINWSATDAIKIAQAELGRRCLFDLARFQVLLHKEYETLTELSGTTSIAFGSHAPFDYVGPSLVKLSNIELKFPEHLPNVSWKNATSFFKIAS